MNKTIALVPMRHDSVRVPRKNFRMFAGRPLYHHIIETLLGADSIDEVVIDTDSEVIMDDAARQFPSVRLLQRPQHLRDGTIAMNEVLLNTVDQLDGDIYLQTHSTNPLLRAATIDQSLAAYTGALPEYDSLFSVTRLQTRLWDAGGRPMNHDPAVLLRTQDLDPVFEENSCIFIFTRQSLETHRNRIGERPQMFEMERLESWDIDTLEEFEMAEVLFNTLARGPAEGVD